ncbi:hypothetical protein [Desulfosarcina sp.]|uniref:hypothetical protein n=1 Tax=Desulfosarcina sp. TaxID=2027861 RepID=UPI0029A6681B|nr:hypothetical protein [Desulfosarcina sp.]MDX2454332.1 hypothetical protein [Desulfosarcina sp.]
MICGWLFSANIPAAVSPIVGGIVFDRMGSFSPVLWGIGGMMACAAIALGMGVSLTNRDQPNFKLNHNVANDPVEFN